ncbi:MAG: MBL fold metallo-hydrolase [Myxococcales bacterium]|nr:MBL fold metallo-hydrolase [Myxococcales bacterium]
MIGAIALGLATACASPVDSETEDVTSLASETPNEIAVRGLAAAENFPGLASLCDLDMVFRDVNVPRSASEQPRSGGGGGGGGSQRPVLPPTQVFDNLYFVGNSRVASWLVGTEEDGYVLFDALTSDAAAEQYIIGGMAELGLDPSKIKHFIVSHGHGDHYGGHRYLTEQLGLPVSMSAPDWALSSTLGVHPRFGPAPVEGEIIEDGQQIELGETLINLYVTSAHTPGTISPMFTVYDNGEPHAAILWGGTGLNFGADEKRLREYAASSNRLRKLAIDQGVDIFISNHPARDGTGEKMEALAARKGGAPHPFVMDEAAIGVFDVFEFCPLAQAERISSGQYQSAD